jgi:hypothetical protein
MSEEQRTTLLSVIWFSMGITSIGVAVSGNLGGRAFITPLLIALLATFAFVGLPSILAARQQQEKAKHRPQDRVALLLELLSDEERAALKDTLRQQVLGELEPGEDGELPNTTLAALLGDQDTGRAARK